MKVKFKGVAPWFKQGSFVDEDHGFRKWTAGEIKEISEVESHALFKKYPKMFDKIEPELDNKITTDYTNKMLTSRRVKNGT